METRPAREVDGAIDNEVERYELREPPTYRFTATRRAFAQTLGAGVLIAVASRQSRGQRRGQPARRDEPLSQRFHLGTDGTITVLTSKVECGQGSRTQLTQAACEELGLPPERVRLIMADTLECPNDGGTAGSRTTPASVPRVRSAAAALRRVLTAHAAQRLGVTAEQVALEDGIFRAAGKQLTLAEIATDPRLVEQLGQLPLPDAPVVEVSQWKVLGKNAAKVGGREVVTGNAKYPSDVQLPGMLYGKIVRPPAYGATLTAIDLAPAQVMEGVTVVRDGDFVGCVAATSWLATQARDALVKTCQWNRPAPQTNNENVFDHFKRTARDNDRGRSGEGSTALSAAKQQFVATYKIPYIQHAPLEPRAAVAQWQDSKLTIWTGSQMPDRVQGELCQAFRLLPEQVRVIVPDTGGGFGGKHTGEAAVEAARLAKGAGQPVSLRWSREEEFTWAYFRPAGLIEVQAGLDDQGRLVAWDFINYNSGGSAVESPYMIAKARSRFVPADSPLRQGSYRALASTANTFARESAMTDLAAMADADPLEFRLRHLPEGRLKDVLKAAADRFRWSERWSRAERSDTSRKRGIGVACGTEKGSYVATCTEIEVIDGEIRVLEVCQAFECGAVQNPVNLRAQNTGAIIMGMGGALFEAIEFADGQIKNPTFSTYRVPRMSDMPELEIVQINRPDLSSVGAGETPIIAIAPAIAGAVHHAISARCRALPLRV